MRPISTRLHGVLDYLVAIVLMAFPWLLEDLPEHPAAATAPLITGAVIFIMSLFTQYELSISGFIPIWLHLVLDAFAGVFLATSPWTFEFSEFIYMPHLLTGIGILVVAFLTKTKMKKDWDVGLGMHQVEQKKTEETTQSKENWDPNAPDGEGKAFP